MGEPVSGRQPWMCKWGKHNAGNSCHPVFFFDTIVCFPWCHGTVSAFPGWSWVVGGVCRLAVVAVPQEVGLAQRVGRKLCPMSFCLILHCCSLHRLPRGALTHCGWLSGVCPGPGMTKVGGRRVGGKGVMRKTLCIHVFVLRMVDNTSPKPGWKLRWK